MKNVELQPGWLDRQMKQSIEEVAKWPPCLQALRHINSELNRPTELRYLFPHERTDNEVRFELVSAPMAEPTSQHESK